MDGWVEGRNGGREVNDVKGGGEGRGGREEHSTIESKEKERTRRLKIVVKIAS